MTVKVFAVKVLLLAALASSGLGELDNSIRVWLQSIVQRNAQHKVTFLFSSFSLCAKAFLISSMILILVPKSITFVGGVALEFLPPRIRGILVPRPTGPDALCTIAQAVCPSTLYWKHLEQHYFGNISNACHGRGTGTMEPRVLRLVKLKLRTSDDTYLAYLVSQCLILRISFIMLNRCTMVAVKSHMAVRQGVWLILTLIGIKADALLYDAPAHFTDFKSWALGITVDLNYSVRLTDLSSWRFSKRYSLEEASQIDHNGLIDNVTAWHTSICAELRTRPILDLLPARTHIAPSNID
jgi:hypothetical protein